MTGGIVFLSGHVWQSPRRAGFHALAQSFLDGGWSVRFVTTGVSRISALRPDARWQAVRDQPRNRWTLAPDGVRSFVYCPAVHPVARSGPTALLSDHLFGSLYPRLAPHALWEGIAGCKIAIVESNAALLLVERLARAMPGVARVYRVSDDVTLLGMARSILDAERRALPGFALVSVPSRHLLARRFAGLPSARFQPHGIDLPRLDAALESPRLSLEYPSCVSLGTTLFDRAMLARGARAQPGMTFHVVGGMEPGDLADMPNIRWWGERPFDEALSIAASADIAAAFYRYRPGVEYLAETSNKIAQYRYFRKPIIGPHWLAEPLGHAGFVALPEDGDEATGRALAAALRMSGSDLPRGPVVTWAETRDAILDAVGQR